MFFIKREIVIIPRDVIHTGSFDIGPKIVIELECGLPLKPVYVSNIQKFIIWRPKSRKRFGSFEMLLIS